MGYWTEDKDGNLKEYIKEPADCKWIYDEVCCNDRCDACCDFSAQDYCESCEFYESDIAEKR